MTSPTAGSARTSEVRLGSTGVPGRADMARKRQATAPKSASAHEGAPRARLFVEQRWLIDNIIRANGIDWDQPRTGYLNAPCGIEANGDFNLIRQRVQKFADCSPAFQDAARRREARAHAAQEAGQLVTARENYFMAGGPWGGRQWPVGGRQRAS